MKKLFTLLMVFMATADTFADNYVVTPSNLAEAQQSDGSYKVEFTKGWDWVNMAWIASGEENTPFDASAYSYLIVEYAEALPFANKIIMQNGSWAAAAQATSQAGASYTEIKLSDEAKTTGVQICAQNATESFGAIYIKSIYFSTEKYNSGSESQTEAIPVKNVANAEDNGDGSYSFTGGWSWNNVWYSDVDWSDYESLVAELAEASEGTTKIQIEYNGGAANTEVYAQAGELTITAPLDSAAKASVKQVALQGEAAFKVKSFYLVRAATDGIKAPVAVVLGNDAVYNLAGQQVGKDYKGIVIRAGKKYVQK